MTQNILTRLLLATVLLMSTPLLAEEPTRAVFIPINPGTQLAGDLAGEPAGPESWTLSDEWRDGAVGQPYYFDSNDTISVLPTTATLGPVSWQFSWGALGQPPGLSVSAEGVISGTPTTKGQYVMVATATTNYGSESVGSSIEIIDPDCYNPDNLGKIGTEGDCDGMLIVTRNNLLDAVADESFAVTGPDGLSYTFADGGRNIFTGQVTTFYNLFNGSSFNGDIGYWDTSNVASLYNTFRDATAFNQDISGWDVGNVTAMYYTFYGATSFNQPIGSWDVSKVFSFLGTFRDAESFNQDLIWNTANVSNMNQMFHGASSFNGDIGGWNTSKVTGMDGMFSATPFNRDISSWDVSSVTDMRMMFYSAQSFNQPIGGWDVRNVTDMGYMFYVAYSFDQDISSWIVDNVSDSYYFAVSAPLSGGNCPDSTWDGC